ncbi:DUF6069 family protein [Brevibacterium casei]|uniref:DUF6069 family protein n=1 Tax=Brevibacterium casei TaxID=33889 RepID=UPI003EEFA813
MRTTPIASVPDARSTSRKRRSVWSTGMVVFAAAGIVDGVIAVVAGSTGVEMTVVPQGGPAMLVGVGAVLLALFISVAIGTLTLAAVGRRRSSRWRFLAIVGFGLSIVSIAAPLSAQATGTTTATLVAMHIVAGLIWFVALWQGAKSQYPTEQSA